MSTTSTQPRRLEFEKRGETVIAHLFGPRITNVNDIRAIGEALFDVIQEVEPRVLIINFARVNYLPSAMLGKLAAVRTRALTNNGKLRLASLQEPVAHLFEMTQLHRIFDIYEDVEKAEAGS